MWAEFIGSGAVTLPLLLLTPPVFASEEREPLFGFSQIRAHEEMRNQEEDLKVKIYLLDFKNLYSK